MLVRLEPATLQSQVKHSTTEPHYRLFTYEPVHEISNNVVCGTSKVSDQPALIVKLLTEHHLRSKLKMRLQRLVRGYTCQNATLLEISCTSSNICDK